MRLCKRVVSLFLALCFLVLFSLGSNVSAADYTLKPGAFEMPIGFDMPKDTVVVFDFYYDTGGYYRFCANNTRFFIDCNSASTVGILPGYRIHYKDDVNFTRYWIDESGTVTETITFTGKSDTDSGFYGTGKDKINKLVVSTDKILSLEYTYETSELFIASLPTESNGILNSLKGFFNTLWEWLQGIWDSIKEIPEKIGSFISALGDRIQIFFTDLKNSIQGFFVKLIDDIKGLFIPDEEFIQGYKDKWFNWFQEHFGALFQVQQLTENLFLSIFHFTPSASPHITLPAIKIPYKGDLIQLTEDIDFTFDFLNTSPWSYFYSLYQTLVWVILFILIIKFAQSTFERIVNK